MEIRKQGHYIHCEHDGYKLTFSLGNRKLGSNILIFSLLAGKKYTCKYNCPKCYAIRDQNRYPAAFNARSKNTRAMKEKPGLLTIAIDGILKKYGPMIDAIRFHESGDIFSGLYSHAIGDAAENATFYGVKSYTYTKTGYRPRHVNVVESILPDGSLNYGPNSYIVHKAKQHGAIICPSGKTRKKIICGKDCIACQKRQYVVFLQH